VATPSKRFVASRLSPGERPVISWIVFNTDWNPTDWKPMPSIGPGVREIRIMHEGQFRLIYIAKLADTVCVLHAFQKKTQKTRKQDIDAAKQALKQL
jgi:phage-related protein